MNVEKGSNEKHDAGITVPTFSSMIGANIQKSLDDLRRYVAEWDAEISKSAVKIAEGFQQIDQAFPANVKVLADNGG